MPAAVIGAEKTAPTVRIVRDQPRRLNLRQSVNLALKRNLRLKQQTEAIAEAEARLREKQNEYGPRLQFDFLAYTWEGIFADTKVTDPDIPREGTGRAQLTLYIPVWFARRQREAGGASRWALSCWSRLCRRWQPPSSRTRT